MKAARQPQPAPGGAGGRQEPTPLYLQAFALWERRGLSPLEGGYLEKTTIEEILLQIEHLRLSGQLELSRTSLAARAGFAHGFFVSFSEVPSASGAGRLARGDLLGRLLAWRSGSFRFLPGESLRTSGGFPLRPGQLLTLAWLFLMENRRRFLERRELFADFLNFRSGRPEAAFLRQIARARVEGLSGTLAVRGRQGERTLNFAGGELRDVLCPNEGSRVSDLLVRHGMLTLPQLCELERERQATHESLVHLALARAWIDEELLNALFALQKWERTFECCHWSELAVAWHEPGRIAPQGSAEPPARPLEAERTAELQIFRCRFCGAEADRSAVCKLCGTRRRRVESVRNRADREGRESAQSPFSREKTPR